MEESHTREGRVARCTIEIGTRDSTCLYKAKSGLFKYTDNEAVLLAINH